MKILLFLRVILLIMLLVIVFLVTNETITFAYWYSDIFILFTCFIALITCFKYDVIKYIFEKSKKHKFILATIVIIAFLALINLVYYFVPQIFEIQDWDYLIYIEQNNTIDTLLSFVFLPEWYNDLNVFYMTLLETIFSFIFIIIAQAREKLEQKANEYASATKFGVIGYILDRLAKNIFRYKILIIFFILTLTISSKFLTIYSIKMVGFSILALVVIYFIIKNYLSIKKCIDKNKQKYGKENLVIVASPDSTSFSFAGDFINPLYKFYKYNTTSIGKSLLVDAKDYVFVSYDVIRYNLINSNEFKVKSYAIFLKFDFHSFVYENIQMNNLQEKIDQLIGSCYKFIIFPKFSWYYEKGQIQKLKGKYIFRYKNKFDLKTIIDVLNLKEDDISLKEQVLSELNYIDQKEVNDKNIYIKYSLNTIINSFNYIEYFYSLLKICEYIMHYMGLKDIINNPQEIIDRKIKVKDGGLAAWRDSISYDKAYNKNSKEDAEIINSIIKLRTILEFKADYKKDYTFEFKKDLCTTIINIRNNLLGHGVITYDVSERIVKLLFVIAKEFLKVFESVDVTIEEDEKIKKIFGEEINAIYKKNKFVYLYSKMNTNGENRPQYIPEYLNYETGKRIADGDISEKMDKIWSAEDIEEALGKFM